MGILITAGSFGLALGSSVSSEGNIIAGPLSVWLGWDMQGITWRNRFDLIIERTSYRPAGGKWFEKGPSEVERRCGHFLGREWSLLTGSRVVNG